MSFPVYTKCPICTKWLPEDHVCFSAKARHLVGSLIWNRSVLNTYNVEWRHLRTAKTTALLNKIAKDIATRVLV